MTITHRQSISGTLLENLPAPDDSWDRIFRFLDEYSQEIDGYDFAEKYGGAERFLEERENSFINTRVVGGDIPALLAQLYLVYRRHRWLNEFNDTDPEVYRPIVSAILLKIHASVEQP